MKKILSIVLVAVVLVLGTSCSSSNPERTLELFLGELKGGNVDNAAAFLYVQDEKTLQALYNVYSPDKGEFDKYIEDADEFYHKLSLTMKAFEYEITAVHHDSKDIATVDLTLDILDFSTVFADLVKKAVGKVLSGEERINLFDLNPNSASRVDKQILKIAIDSFTEILGSQDLPRKKIDVTVGLYLVDNQWKVDSSQELVNALTGDMEGSLLGLFPKGLISPGMYAVKGSNDTTLKTAGRRLICSEPKFCTGR